MIRALVFLPYTDAISELEKLNGRGISRYKKSKITADVGGT